MAGSYVSTRYLQFIQFAFIGLINTAIHTGIVIGSVELLHFRPVLANAFAFMLANAFSYFLNSKVTFKAPLSIYGYMRFFLVSMVSLFCTLGVSWAGEVYGLHYLISLCFVVIFVPVMNFFILKFWAYSSLAQ